MNQSSLNRILEPTLPTPAEAEKPSMDSVAGPPNERLKVAAQVQVFSSAQQTLDPAASNSLVSADTTKQPDELSNSAHSRGAAEDDSGAKTGLKDEGESPAERGRLGVADRKDGAPADSGKILQRLLKRVGLRVDAKGRVQVSDRFLSQAVREVSPKALPGTLSALTDLKEASLGPVPMGNTMVDMAQLNTFASGMGRAFDDLLTGTMGKPTLVDGVASNGISGVLATRGRSPGIDIHRIAGDSLTAVFLRLNIDNPMDSVAAQNELDEALSNLRQQLIAEQKKMLQNLKEQLEDALDSAMDALGLIATVLVIIVALIAAMLVGIIAAIIIAVVLMYIANSIIDSIKAAIQDKIQEALAMAKKVSDRMIDDFLKKMREEQMKRIAEMSLVGPDGKPITSKKLRARLQPRLEAAISEILGIMSEEGFEAAQEQGPQIIHDSMYDELILAGVPPEHADGMAWAIAEETMVNLGAAYEEHMAIDPGMPLDAQGQPLSDAEITARLMPSLVRGLTEVTRVLDAEGVDAATQRGPQIIHDAVIAELLAMGIAAEAADEIAWAIAAKSMEDLGLKLTPPAIDSRPAVLDPLDVVAPSPGRHPSEVVGVGPTPAAGTTGAPEYQPPANPDTTAPAAGHGPGRHPSEIVASTSAAFSVDTALNLGLSALMHGIDVVDAGSLSEFGDKDSDALTERLIMAKDEALQSMLDFGRGDEQAKAQHHYGLLA